jgi:hypothetical protein
MTAGRRNLTAAGRILRWIGLVAAGLVAAAALYLLVVLIGAALHLWPISAR